MRMNQVLKAGAGILWAAVAIGTAASANADAFTGQTGNYATCGGSYSVYPRSWCHDLEMDTYEFYTNYTQQIKLVSTACSSGPCSADTSTVYVDAVYPAGRKSATSLGPSCSMGPSIHYVLASCGC
jgi:hypothetical protein